MAKQHVRITMQTKQFRMPKLALNKPKRVNNGKRKA